MKKRIIYLLLAILTLISFNSVVLADTSCEYDNKNVVVIFDGQGKPKVDQKLIEKAESNFLFFYKEKRGQSSNIKVSGQYIEANEFSELVGMCPEKISLCTFIEDQYSGIVEVFTEEAIITSQAGVSLYSSGSRLGADLKKQNRHEGFDFYTIMGDEIAAAEGFWETTGSFFVGLGKEVWSFLGGDGEEEKTWLGAYYYDCYKDLSYEGNLPTYNLDCPGTEVYFQRLSKGLEDYSSSKKSKDTSKMITAATTVNEVENTLNNYCLNILSSYNTDGNSEEECIRSCLDIATKIKEAKKSVGLLSSEDAQCGFSGNLIIWISNIVRWVKYIIPVVVIILGILDFIKAIASESDDEMKKAQKRFIVRLIVAALIFIIPFIIEFILDKMGFAKYIDGCGIIDL